MSARPASFWFRPIRKRAPQPVDQADYFIFAQLASRDQIHIAIEQSSSAQLTKHPNPEIFRKNRVDQLKTSAAGPAPISKTVALKIRLTSARWVGPSGCRALLAESGPGSRRRIVNNGAVCLATGLTGRTMEKIAMGWTGRPEAERIPKPLGLTFPTTKSHPGGKEDVAAFEVDVV
ncbi:hypothetical protein NM208_g14719 [Fusarium decemcellulare]|uniref:Uncharacterized protein n=1 Tax=Fusarium decemcellulare TaxID=57161 RepID=A0ACC1RF51_9HYPO|nr:hypothetical protein NM208_g14719 [Fusarium decemcellulare]